MLVNVSCFFITLVLDNIKKKAKWCGDFTATLSTDYWDSYSKITFLPLNDLNLSLRFRGI